MKTRFGRWTLVEKLDKHLGFCKCDCGTERAVLLQNLRNGKSQSCGCQKAEMAKLRSKEVQAKIHTDDMVRDNQLGFKGVVDNGSSYTTRISVSGFNTPEAAHAMYCYLKSKAREYERDREIHS